MTKYQQKSFTVPATNATKVPCAIHHFVKGECLRCGMKKIVTALDGKVEFTHAIVHPPGKPSYVVDHGESVPTDSEGATE